MPRADRQRNDRFGDDRVFNKSACNAIVSPYSAMLTAVIANCCRCNRIAKGNNEIAADYIGIVGSCNAIVGHRDRIAVSALCLKEFTEGMRCHL